MSLAITPQQLLPLVQAVEQVTGRKPHLSTVIRWVKNGAKGCKLQSATLGGRRFTTVEDVKAFLEATTLAASSS